MSIKRFGRFVWHLFKRVVVLVMSIVAFLAIAFIIGAVIRYSSIAAAETMDTTPDTIGNTLVAAVVIIMAIVSIAHIVVDSWESTSDKPKIDSPLIRCSPQLSKLADRIQKSDEEMRVRFQLEREKSEAQRRNDVTKSLE